MAFQLATRSKPKTLGRGIEGDCFIDGMSNDDYRSPSLGISTSDVKDFMSDPGSVIWNSEAPQDKDKMPAIDFGTDFHSYFLEPQVFQETYKVLPPCNRRIVAEKQAELDLIERWKAEGKIPCKHEDMEKLESMRLSAMAHPTVKTIMNLKGGIAERSFFWIDPLSGLKLKCRPDWYVEGQEMHQSLYSFVPFDAEILVADLKTISDLSKIRTQMEELKYYVQDAFYSNGISHVRQKKVCFVFIFVSTTLSLGRYPVVVRKLNQISREEGAFEIVETLEDYRSNLQSDHTVWNTAVEMDRPSYATRFIR